MNTRIAAYSASTVLSLFAALAMLGTGRLALAAMLGAVFLVSIWILSMLSEERREAQANESLDRGLDWHLGR